MFDAGILVPIALFVCGAAVAIGVPLARAFARRMDRQGAGPAIPYDVTSQLERMEQALDAIAIEVERVSEGQRFTSKLLAERPSVPIGNGAEQLSSPAAHE